MIAEKIDTLYREASKLEPSEEVFKHTNQVVQKYAFEFIQELKHAKTYQADLDVKMEIPEYQVGENPKDIESLISVIDKHISFSGLVPSSGGHVGYIPGGGIYPAALGDYLADILNSYSGIYFATSGAVRLENMLIRWMCKMVGFPKSALGNLTSGGSIANQIAIVTARDKKLKHSDQYAQAVIYLTDQIHHSVTKSIRIAGLRYAHIRTVPMDKRFRMDASALQQQIKEDEENGLIPFLVVGSAGTTDTGAVDPLEEIANIAAKHNLWFHVDGAYGGFFMLIDETRDKFKGIELADSVTIDPHKGLFLPYGLGAVLIKDVAAMNDAHFYKANYMQDAVEIEEEPSPADLSPELTKPFRGLRMWLPLKLFGLKTYKAAIEEKIWLCRYFYEEIQKIEGMEVGPFPDLSVSIWRYNPGNKNVNEVNKLLAQKIIEDGRVFFSSTTIDGDVWMRIAVLSFRTHKNTIDLGLKMIREITQTL